ncbi:hypothetical protein [Clostridium estertheticum]|nr:hypothetical protein [Clostridium estertheticum]
MASIDEKLNIEFIDNMVPDVLLLNTNLYLQQITITTNNIYLTIP